MTEEPQNYVRWLLYSAGFANPTDELVNEIYATALRSSAVVALHPYVIADALVSLLRAYYPVVKSLEFIESMQQLQTQAGGSEAELDDISQGILRLAEEIPQPVKPKQKLPYYQKDRAQWWKGRRPV